MADTSLLPPNATQAERALAMAAGDRLDAMPVPLRELWDVQTCPANLLPWLAYAWGVDSWNSDWDDATQRATVQAAIVVKQHRGTISAVRQALLALGVSVQVQEWFAQAPQADPYTYRVLLSVTQRGFSAADLAEVMAVAERSKNVRSHMSAMHITTRSDATLTFSAACTTGIRTEVTQALAAPLILNPYVIVI